MAIHLYFELIRNSQSAAIKSIAPKIGCGLDTLRKWVRRAETDSGLRYDITTAERDRIKALERENRQLKQTNGILKKASALKATVVGCPQCTLSSFFWHLS